MTGPTHQAMPRIGDRVDRYEICGEIDSGGMSVIYAVKRVGAVGGWSKLLAMKVILPNLARQERFSRMFLDEARTLSLVQHPNLVQVHDVGETEAGLLYMVMELLRGRSLAKLIREALRTDGTLDRGVLLGVLGEAAEGLHAAHETSLPDGTPARIVHRDVSPQNIHVGFDGIVKVVDFGIAAVQGRMTDTRTGELKGKPSYIAPEQILRHPVDRRADIWSIGVVAWEILAGRRLFTGDNEIETIRNVDAMEVPAIGLLAKGLPARTTETIMRCLMRDSAQRPATAALVASAFREGAAALAGGSEGGGSVEARRTYVQRLLGKDMAVENERLVAVGRQGPPPRVHDLSPEEEISDPFRIAIAVEDLPSQEARPLRRLALLAAVALAAVLGAGLATWALVGGGGPSAAGAPGTSAANGARAEGSGGHASATPAGQPTAEVQAPPATQVSAAERFVLLELDPRIETVRVDGHIVTERPVQVLVKGAPVIVEAVGRAGERVRHVLGTDVADRFSLALPSPGSGPRPGKGTSRGKSPLLGNPYQRRSP
jgi:serine/threonine-protein kinase